jgi:hypothetical protein
MPSLEDIEKQAAAMLGLKTESIGKTQARQNFLPLVDSLSHSASAVEITDHDKPVAILLSYNHWLVLASKLCMLQKGQAPGKSLNLIGSVQINSDLEQASRKVAAKFKKSMKATAKKL